MNDDQPDTKRGPSSPPRQPRALLVEDDAVCARVALMVLRQAGYAVERVGSARGARAALDGGGRFDVALVDVQIWADEHRDAEADGLELVERIRACDPHARVIVWTASENADVATRALAAGAAFLRKGGDAVRALQELLEAP